MKPEDHRYEPAAQGLPRTDDAIEVASYRLVRSHERHAPDLWRTSPWSGSEQ